MYICRHAHVPDLKLVNIHNITINPVPAGDEWREGLLKDLLHERGENTGLLDTVEVQQIIDLICCS